MSNHDGHNKNRNLLQRKSRFPLIVELIQAFDLSHYLVREVKNLSPDFKKLPHDVYK